MTLAITAAFASLLPLAAHGADQDETAAAPTTLGSIVVTATRREEVLQKVPSAVTAISGDEVQDGELRSTKDVAKFVPGTQGWNTESRARPRFFIRGVGSNEATNNVVNPIAIYTDQVYYGNSLFLGSPLFDLKRVEVLRGPQGTLWGKNTTGGAFHFISQQPTFDTTGYAKFEVGNYDTRIAEGAIGGALKDDTLAGRAALHLEKRGGLATNTTTGNDVGDFTDFAGRFQLLAVVSDDFDASIKAQLRKLDGTQNPWYSVTKNGAPDRYGYTAPIGDGSGDRDHVAYSIDLPLRVETQGLGATLNWNLAGGLTLTSITSLDHGDRTAIIDADYTPYEWTGSGGRSYSKNTVTQASEELRLASAKNQPLSWIGGVYVFHDKNDSLGVGANLTGATASQNYYYTKYTQDTTSSAVFGSATYAFTDALRLGGGLRYTSETTGIDLQTIKAGSAASAYAFNGNWWDPNALTNATYSRFFTTGGRVSNTWSNVGYDLTPEYRLADNQLVYFRHASGFRSGNYNTYINPSSALSTVSQFAVVKPEKLKSYELGYKSSWLDNRLVFNTDIYHYDYRDMQLVINQVFNSIFFPTLANAGKGKVDGIEFETQYQPVQSVKLRANLSALRTKFTELNVTGVSYAGYNFARVPQRTLLLGADKRFGLSNGVITLGTDWTYTSKLNFNVTNNTDPYALQDAYWLGNLRASYSTNHDKLIVGAYVNNVADKRYKNQAMLYQGAVAGAGGHYPTGYGDPRLFGLTLTLKY